MEEEFTVNVGTAGAERGGGVGLMTAFLSVALSLAFFTGFAITGDGIGSGPVPLSCMGKPVPIAAAGEGSFSTIVLPEETVMALVLLFFELIFTSEPESVDSVTFVPVWLGVTEISKELLFDSVSTWYSCSCALILSFFVFDLN